MKRKQKNSFPCYRGFGIAVFLILMVLFSGCNSRKANDGIFVTPKELDSLATEIQLDNMLNGSYISIDEKNKYRYPALKRRNDKRYLPYIVLALTEKQLPLHILNSYNSILFSMCEPYDNDSLLYIGHLVTDRLNKKGELYSIPLLLEDYYSEERRREPYYGTPEKIGSKIYDIDSLRVRVVGFNDRNALSLLEQYYKMIGLEKELGVYYKLMICFEGNGDLAERYYNVLKPYLNKQPEFYNSIREVLLRAALCDHNARAQELCDSLGFSLCDYRLPLLDE